MSVSNYNLKDVIVTCDINLKPLSDLVNEEGVITPKFNEDRAAAIASLDGEVHNTFNASSVGTVTFKLFHLSSLKTQFLLQMNREASGVIVIKNKSQLTDLTMLTSCVVKSVESTGVGKGGSKSPELTVVLEGRLTMF